MNTLTFDIEIVKEIPNNVDWKTIRPLGISCAATYLDNEIAPRKWYHGMNEETPLSGAMTPEEVNQLINYLESCLYKQTNIVTWNGLQFDFNVLAEEGTEREKCVGLALNHIDMMFQIFCLKGYPVGLNSVAHGLGLPGKTEGMSGALAPVMWANSVEDRYKVLEYVAQDVITTMDVYNTINSRKSLCWTSKSGKFQYMPIDRWLYVNECVKLQYPDTSWMTDPLQRESFVAWLR